MMGKRLAAALLICTAWIIQSPNAGVAASAAPTVSERIVNRFMQLDVDDSDTVSLEEYMEMVSQRGIDRFNAMDRNHNGEVTPDERTRYWKRKQAKWYRLNR
ncbi:MAG: thymidylate synthase [Mariprofundales bacterium]